MRACFCLPLIAVLLYAAGAAPGADRRPLREARSENRRFWLRVQPGQPQRGQAGHCRAILFERAAEGQRGRRVWIGKLANDVAPGHALIRNDGRFVVTLDEYRRGGAAHAVVIYDGGGKQLREFDLRELLRGNDWKNVTVNRRAIEWLPEASFAFVDAPPQFIIRLRWGREIRINLEKTEISPDSPTSAPGAPQNHTPSIELDDLTARAADEIPAQILALLEQVPTSAPSPAANDEATPAQDTVRRALADLQRLAALSGVEVEGLESTPPAEVTTTSPATTSPELSPDESGSAIIAEEQQPGLAGNSGSTGVPVPAPDPANPADYVAWMKAQTLTEGPSAVPWYQAAIDNCVDWTGSAELFEAAMDGDAEALASPEIAAWLEANAEALEQFRAATQLEYRGMPMETADGTVIGFLLPHLSKMRLLSKTAVIKAQQLESLGEYDAAMDVYLDTLAGGAHAGQGPTLIENLVGVAVQSLASDRMLDSFAADDDGHIDYARLAEALPTKYRPTRPIEETFQFERAMILDVAQRGFELNPETGNYRVSEEGLQQLSSTMGFIGEGSPDEVALGFMLGNIGFENMTDQINTHYDGLTDAVRMPYQQGRQKLQKLEDEISDPAFRWRNPLLSMLLPSLSRAAHLGARNEASRRATMLITNLKAYRQQHGDYPDSLDVFGGTTMASDPFTSERFVYRRDGDDFTLYSLGGNGVDDGGVHDRRGDTNDLVYWPRPPKQ